VQTDGSPQTPSCSRNNQSDTPVPACIHQAHERSWLKHRNHHTGRDERLIELGIRMHAKLVGKWHLTRLAYCMTGRFSISSVHRLKSHLTTKAISPPDERGSCLTRSKPAIIFSASFAVE
ncbi:hypothetical protein TSMEX_008543, partial [Taenia solium]